MNQHRSAKKNEKTRFADLGTALAFYIYGHPVNPMISQPMMAPGLKMRRHILQMLELPFSSVLHSYWISTAF